MLLSCGEGAARGLNSGCLDLVLLLQGEGFFTLQEPFPIGSGDGVIQKGQDSIVHQEPPPHLSEPFLCLYTPSAEGHLLLDALSAMGHPLCFDSNLLAFWSIS